MKYFQNLALAENLENMDLRHTRRLKLFSWQCPTNVVRNPEDFDPLIIHNNVSMSTYAKQFFINANAGSLNIFHEITFFIIQMIFLKE